MTLMVQYINVLIKAIKLFILTPLFILIRSIKPIKLIRFGNLRSNRIGHFALNTELYLCEKDNNMQSNNSIDVFFYDKNKGVCNYQLLKMWKRILRVNQIAALFYKYDYLPGVEEHKIKTVKSERDIYGLMEKSKVHLYFTPDEEHVALKELKSMGIEKNDLYVCLAVRDSAYLKKKFPHKDFSYHNYRDNNIQNYILSAIELAKRGYFVIRMGAIVNEALNINHPQIIDYATNGCRTELLDIYLSANCHFFISTPIGLEVVPLVFRRPIVYTNVLPIEHATTWNSKALIIFKKHWLKKEKRFMTFREIIESGVGRYLRTEDYEKQGIELIENSPEEILDVILEMDERLKGNWETADEDEELQKRFWTLFKPSDLNKVIRARIGTKFLRQNKGLLN
ncbi:MAG: TIGR04372 family glycosyltransferase [Nitrospirae bacterium]|nr:TIGR04372 family glycosyltransferase [Nitrospirota bacterium]